MRILFYNTQGNDELVIGDLSAVQVHNNMIWRAGAILASYSRHKHVWIHAASGREFESLRIESDPS
jgi:hypothetical protein